MASTVQLTYTRYICGKACSWRDMNFVAQKCSLSIQSALSVTVAFREILSTAAVMKFTGGHFATCGTPVSCMYRAPIYPVRRLNRAFH